MRKISSVQVGGMGRLDSWTTTADQCNFCFLHFVVIFYVFFSCGSFLFLRFLHFLLQMDDLLLSISFLMVSYFEL